MIDETRCPGGWLICAKHGQREIVSEGCGTNELDEPSYFAELDCGCVVADPLTQLVCEKHQSTVEIVDEHCVSGFTGAPIYFVDLSCGCQLVDASQDNLGAVE